MKIDSYSKTRYPELGYKQIHGDWRLILISEGDDPGIIGMPYKTKAELLADLEYQHNFRINQPKPTT